MNEKVLDKGSPKDIDDLQYVREALKLSYKERFLMATRLYKIHQTMQKAIIHHKPFKATIHKSQ
jgi:hypothetical protein